MKIKKYICILSIILLMFSCSNKQEKVSYDEIGSSGNTTRTENLVKNLYAFQSKGTMVGQMYGTLQGVGWMGDSARSDMRSICGAGPACVGYELAGLNNQSDVNKDSLSFGIIRKDILYNFNKGGLITATWSVQPTKDDKQLKSSVEALSSFLSSLQDDYGIKAPVVLFLYPYKENSAVASLSSDDYKKQYHQTKELLKETGVNNVVYGFSTTSSKSIDYIPVDDINVIDYRYLVDGQDFNEENYQQTLDANIKSFIKIAQEEDMVLGLTTGVEGLPQPKLFSEVVKPLIERYTLSYLMFGPNRGKMENPHFCIPYPGWNNEAITDFLLLHNFKKTIFINNLNGLYLLHSN